MKPGAIVIHKPQTSLVGGNLPQETDAAIAVEACRVETVPAETRSRVKDNQQTALHPLPKPCILDDVIIESSWYSCAGYCEREKSHGMDFIVRFAVDDLPSRLADVAYSLTLHLAVHC